MFQCWEFLKFYSQTQRFKRSGLLIISHFTSDRTMYFSLLKPQINVEFLIFRSNGILFYSFCRFRPASTPRTLPRSPAPTSTRGCPPRATRRPSWPTTLTRRSSRRWGRWCTAATTLTQHSTLPPTTSSGNSFINSPGLRFASLASLGREHSLSMSD